MAGMDFILYTYVFKTCGFPIIYFTLFAINGERVKPDGWTQCGEMTSEPPLFPSFL